ncbi:guanine nucleotide binding protein, alpha subunit [Daedaleopsis nitida]|nr:guanine nucleotide binding protein, alpha subunit [Daedaleopsis nitida]
MANPHNQGRTHHRTRSNSDPLSLALLPPADETPEQRENRLRAEDEAKKRSEHIDRMIRHDEKSRRRRKTVKVLLLGQSESGKSTTLKQFQLLHTPAAFHKERIAWRLVIYLNLVRSIRRILEAIAPEDPANGEEEDFGESTETASIIITGDRPSSSLSGSQPNYELYRRKLAPLADLEQRLITVLSDPDEEGEREATHLPDGSAWAQQLYTPYGSLASASASLANLPSSSTSPTSYSHSARPPRIMIPPTSAPASSHPSAYPSSVVPTSPRSPTSPAMSMVGSTLHEPSIRTGSKWKEYFALGKIQSPKSAHSGELEGWWEDPNDPVHTLNRCAAAMSELWRDPKVHQRLAERRIRLEESSGFYLDDIERITAKMYFPTDDDVLKARLKTTGVVEHKFTLTKNSEFRGVEWVIYDVGGARNQRQAWAPYFDDVNAIIFLAPISAFDQQLAEDPRVNRLEDSFMLWKSVIESKLLAHVNIVLFLNKCDLLKKKLESGERLHHHMPSYNRPNDYETVSKYFRNRFGAMHQQLTPNKSRELFIHLTSVTETRKTHIIISNVRDIILTANLKSSSLM